MPRANGGRLVVLLGLLLPAAALHGQAPDQPPPPHALTGLTEARPRVIVQWDMAVTMRGGAVRADFERDLRNEFEVGLRGAGLRLDETAPVYLDCVVEMRYVERSSPTVVLSRVVRVSMPEHPSQALSGRVVAWSRSDAREVARDALSGADVGRGCAAEFQDEWQRANGGASPASFDRSTFH